MNSNYSFIHLKALCLFSVVIYVSFIPTEQLSLPGCPRKCGNLTIPFPFGMSSKCSIDESFHIICNSSFKPPKPFLGSAEVLSISLQGKMKILISSSEFGGRDGESAPVVIHWTVGNIACHVSRKNSASRYPCQSRHSQCEDSSLGHGYICRCLPGYHGNPYLVHGCQDIDECADSNPCEGTCVNLEGSFKCYCPEGSVGDGRKHGTGCQRQEEKIPTSSSYYSPTGILFAPPALVTAWIVWIGRQKKLRKLKEDRFEQNGGNLLLRKLSKCKNTRLSIFTSEDIKSITMDYNSKSVELKCFHGAFYQGALPEDDNTECAVLMVERVPKSQIKQFVDQLILLSQPHKKNVVRVIGCCLETHSPLLVYELHGVGDSATLFDCTRGRGRAPFSCEMRVKAAAGVAKGLASLAPFVHGNICSEDIVINTASYDAKIYYPAGSNLIPLLHTKEHDVFTDPEYIRIGLKSSKSDVYSFGVVLVELLTGGRTVSSNRGEYDRNMVLDFVHMRRAGRLREILDDEMVGEAESKVVREIAALAEKCLHVKPSKRPKMKEVEAKLVKLVQGNRE